MITYSTKRKNMRSSMLQKPECEYDNPSQAYSITAEYVISNHF